MIDAQEFLRRHPVDSDDSVGQTQPMASGQQADSSCEGANQPGSRHSASRVSAAERFAAKRPISAKSLGAIGTSRQKSVFDTDTGRDADDEYDACLESALKSLEAAGTSKDGLRKRLEKRKRFTSGTIDRVVAAVEQMGLIDDSLYAESVIRSCVRRQMGYYGALRELLRKGVDRGVAQHALIAAQEAGQFDESAQLLAQTMCMRTRGLDARKRLSRLYAAARRKGHDTSVVRQYADEIIATEEDASEDASEDVA